MDGLEIPFWRRIPVLDRHELLFAYVEKFVVHRKQWEAEWINDNESGLNGSQAMTIVLLKRIGPMQAKDLTSYLAISSGGTTVVTDKLIDKGLIRKTQHEKDRRGIVLELTQAGHDYYPIVEKSWNRVMDAIFSPLTDLEVAILTQLFTKLVVGK